MSGNPILTDAFIATEATLFQIEKVEQKLQKWYPTHDVSYTTTYSDGYRRGQAQGALHFDVTKDKGGTVTGAEVTFSGGGQNPVLTVSNGKCERPDEPPEQFDDLTVTDRCVNGNGSITVSNSNDDPITVTVSGPDGYETENEVPAGGSVEFAGLANGTYDLETDDDSVGLNRSTVRIDY